MRDYHASIGLTGGESWSTPGALADEPAGSRILSGLHGLRAAWGLPMVFYGAGFPWDSLGSTGNRCNRRTRCILSCVLGRVG